MEMQQVRYFVALADTLNFTRAAEQCNVTQPVLTRAIKALEDELGGELIRREGRLSHLSELGQRMLPLLRQCLDSALSAKSLARSVAVGETPSLAIGMSRTVDAALLIGSLMEIYRVFPRIQLKLRRGTGKEIGQLLKNGDIEIAVAGPLGDGWERLDAWPMFTESFDVLVGAGHELARRNEKCVEIDVIRNQQLLMQTGSEMANEELDKLGAKGIRLANAHQVETELRLGGDAGRESRHRHRPCQRAQISALRPPQPARSRSAPDGHDLYGGGAAPFAGSGRLAQSAARRRLGVYAGQLARRLERDQKIFDLHTPAIIRIDIARHHLAIRTDNEGRGDGQDPRIVALINGDVPPSGGD